MSSPSTMPEKIFDPNTEDVPTPVRINAVGYYVQKEPLLVAKMRDQQVKVRKRDGSTVSFPIDVYEISCQIHKDGKDALKIGKTEILAIARTFLGIATSSTPGPKATATSISEKGADLAGRAIHNFLSDAARLETSREGGNSEVASQIRSLISEMGFAGEPKTPSVVPYTLVLSASQLAEIHPSLVQFKPKLEKVISHYQALSIA